MESPREQLRAYVEFDEILTDLLKKSGRYQGGPAARLRIDRASLEAVGKIENLLHRDQYLFDQETKDLWRGAKLKSSGVSSAQDIDAELAEMLVTNVRSQIGKLTKTLNFK